MLDKPMYFDEHNVKRMINTARRFFRNKIISTISIFEWERKTPKLTVEKESEKRIYKATLLPQESERLSSQRLDLSSQKLDLSAQTKQ